MSWQAHLGTTNTSKIRLLKTNVFLAFMFDGNSENICSHFDSEIIINFYLKTENMDLASYMSKLFQTDGKIVHFATTSHLWLFKKF